MRLARVFYLGIWKPWRALICRLAEGGVRETLLSYYGLSSLLILLAFWAGGLVVGFAALYWAFGSGMRMAFGSPSWWVDVYVSATTFSTLGLGDVTPASNVARMLMVAESGLGFAFLAFILSYLPALNTAFADREVEVSLLDEHAGSPPTAVELLRRDNWQVTAWDLNPGPPAPT